MREHLRRTRVRLTLVYVGVFALVMSRLAPRGQVFAFEPATSNDADAPIDWQKSKLLCRTNGLNQLVTSISPSKYLGT